MRSQGHFKTLVLVSFFSLVIVGCGSQPTELLEVPSAAAELVSSSVTPSATITPTSSPTADQIATLNAKATMDIYDVVCEQEYRAYSLEEYPIWPNGEWVAIGCRYQNNNMDLIVQNQDGLKWLVRFADYTNPSHDFERSGLEPLGWSPDGRFLYFTKGLSSRGISDSQCFARMDDFGLYRLDLETGHVAILVATDDNNSWMIEFAPTNEYYAISADGMTITNVLTGDVINIDVGYIVGMSWSPDGRYLAFSVASCGEFLVESASIYAWDSLTKETQLLYSSNDNLLTPYAWITNSLLEFEGEKLIERSTFYTTFRYDLESDEIVYSATETP